MTRIPNTPLNGQEWACSVCGVIPDDLVERLRGTKHTIQEAFYDMREAAARIAELEHRIDLLETDEARLCAENNRMRAQLGNSVGAIIDSGGYCEGPHDVAAAIYRLTAERDCLRAVITEIANDDADEFICPVCESGRVRTNVCPQCGEMFEPSAVGGAPGVSETHTDPGVVVLPDGRIVRPYRGPWPGETHTDPATPAKSKETP